MVSRGDGYETVPSPSASMDLRSAVHCWSANMMSKVSRICLRRSGAMMCVGTASPGPGGGADPPADSAASTRSMSRMLARTLPISCWSELPAASEAQMCVMRSLKLDASELEEPGQQQQQQQQHGQIRAGVDLPVKKPGQQAAGAAGSWAGRICQLGGAGAFVSWTTAVRAPMSLDAKAGKSSPRPEGSMRSSTCSGTPSSVG
jgi:hypothetical protein